MFNTDKGLVVKNAIYRALTSKKVINALKEQGIEVDGMSEDGLLFSSVVRNRKQFVAVKPVTKDLKYRGDLALTRYNDALKSQIEELKERLAFYESLNQG